MQAQAYQHLKQVTNIRLDDCFCLLKGFRPRRVSSNFTQFLVSINRSLHSLVTVGAVRQVCHVTDFTGALGRSAGGGGE